MSDVRRIDDYLDALARDPHAPPPDGLDTDLVATARQVRAATQAPPLDAAARDRLWATALASAQAEADLPQMVMHGNGSKVEPMLRSIAHAQEAPRLPARRAGRRSFALPWVAALIGVICLTVLLWMGVPTGPFAAGWLLQATPTPTSLLPTFPPYQNGLFAGQQATPGGPIIDLTADRDQILEGTLTAEQPVAVYHLAEGQSGLLLMQAKSASRTIAHLGLSDQLVPTQAFTSLIVGQTGLIRASAPWYVYVGSAGPVTEPIAFQLAIRIFATAEEESPAIAYGETIEGHFDGLHLPMFRFEGTNGDVVRVAVTTRDTVDSELILFQPRLETIDDDSGPGFDPELLDVLLYRTGSYLLAVVPKETDAVGDFQLTLERTGQQVPPTAPFIPDTSAALQAATRLTPGQPVRASLPPEGYASYRFRVEAHGLFAAQVASDDPAGLPDMQYTFRITAFNQPGGTGNVAPITAALDLLDVYPVSDVLLSVIGVPGQAYTLNVAPLEVVELVAGETIDGTLSEAVPLAVYALHLRAEEAVTLAVSGQDGFDTRLALFDWRWQRLAADDDSGAGRDPELSAYTVPEDSALYAVVLPQAEDAPAGTFRLRMSPVP